MCLCALCACVLCLCSQSWRREINVWYFRFWLKPHPFLQTWQGAIFYESLHGTRKSHWRNRNDSCVRVRVCCTKHEARSTATNNFATVQLKMCVCVSLRFSQFQRTNNKIRPKNNNKATHKMVRRKSKEKKIHFFPCFSLLFNWMCLRGFSPRSNVHMKNTTTQARTAPQSKFMWTRSTFATFATETR